MAEAASGRPIWSLGLMSGTSMDGIDAAMVLTDGVSIEAFGPAGAVGPAAGEAVRAIAADWQSYRSASGEAELSVVQKAEASVLRDHAIAVMALLEGPALLREPLPEVFGFHGQTVAHCPEEGWTWQLGDGAALARLLARPVVWDFRSADMAAGGEGAPLAPFYHWALARRIGAQEPLCFLNIGGVANLTWVDPLAERPDADGALVAFDTGPGNALIDDFVRARAGVPLDRDGALAGAGTVHARLLASNAAGAYFAREGPKSLDRNAFQAVRSAAGALSTEDGAATLTAFTAECVARASAQLPVQPTRWLVCGGGRLNPTLMAMLSGRLEAPVEAVEAAGLDGDMLEAQAFAYLAVRALRGLPLSAPGTTGCERPVTGGRIEHP